MHCLAGSAIRIPRRIIFRSPIAVALAAVFFAASLGGAGGWSSALAQKPEGKSASDNSDNKGKTGEKSAKSEDGKGGNKKSGRRGRGGPATVVLDTVIQGISVETVQVYGRVIARQSSVVAARTRGAVGGILADVGDRVRKDDVLVTLVSSMLDAERALKAAEKKEFDASIQTAGAQLALAAQELERLERLRKSAAFSVARYQDKLRDVERFKSSLAEARAKSDQAQAELRMADINLHNAKIRAPFDGVVTQRHVELGNYVSVGNKVITVLNDASLEVEAEIPANRLSGLSVQTEIDVRPEFGASFKATVRAIVPEENALARTRLVRFTPTFGPANKTVASNQSVILHIPAGVARNAVTVHKDAVTQRRGKKVVFVADEEQKTVAMRPVDLGDAFGTRFEVLKGLQPGDKVVIKGNERLRPNQPIQVQSADAGGNGGGNRGKGRRGGRSESGANGKRGGS